MVAIKKMLFPFKTPIHAQRTYRELKLLIYLNHPDAQVCIKSLFFRILSICIVFLIY